MSTTEIIAVAVVVVVAALAVCISVTCICINRHNKKKDQHYEYNRQNSRVNKFTETQKTIRCLNRFLLLANEEQATYIRTELDSLQGHAGRLAADDAEMRGIVADDSGEGNFYPIFIIHLSYVTIYVHCYNNKGIVNCIV